jgi:hypothetical protein
MVGVRWVFVSGILQRGAQGAVETANHFGSIIDMDFEVSDDFDTSG